MPLKSGRKIRNERYFGTELRVVKRGVPDFGTDPREYIACLGATEENNDGEVRETNCDLMWER